MSNSEHAPSGGCVGGLCGEPGNHVERWTPTRWIGHGSPGQLIGPQR